MTDEKAKAVQEVAKASVKAMEIAEKTGPFLERTFGPLLENAVGVISDKLAFYRLDKFYDLKENTEKKLLDRGVSSFRPLPPKFGIPLIEAATLEDDENLHDMWAELLANALDPNKSTNPKRMFVSLLQEMGGLEVSIISFLSTLVDDPFANIMASGHNAKMISKEVAADIEDVAVALLNLFRLGVVSDMRPDTWESLGYPRSGLRVHDDDAAFILTTLGRAFVAACKEG